MTDRKNPVRSFTIASSRPNAAIIRKESSDTLRTLKKRCFRYFHCRRARSFDQARRAAAQCVGQDDRARLPQQLHRYPPGMAQVKARGDLPNRAAKNMTERSETPP